MTTFLIILAAWLAMGLFLSLAVYVGYGFVMSAVYARDRKDNPSPPRVVMLDSIIALPCVLADGLLNIGWGWAVFADPDPRNMFKRIKFKGITLIVPELITGRCSKYGLDTNERKFRRVIAGFIGHFLMSKDPKGFHFAGDFKRVEWLYEVKKLKQPTQG